MLKELFEKKSYDKTLNNVFLGLLSALLTDVFNFVEYF